MYDSATQPQMPDGCPLRRDDCPEGRICIRRPDCQAEAEADSLSDAAHAEAFGRAAMRFVNRAAADERAGWRGGYEEGDR